MNFSTRLKAVLARNKELVKRLSLAQTVEEFEAALQRYASLLDEINGKEDGTTLKLIVKVLKEDVGIPIHNIPSDFHADELQNAVEQLQVAIKQKFEINGDDVRVYLDKQVEAIARIHKPKTKHPQKAIKTKGKITPGFKQPQKWNRTRSNPKLR